MDPQPIARGSSALKLSLRVLSAPGAPAGLSADSTLSEFYWNYWRGVLEKQGKDARTLDQYDQSIDYWAQYAKGAIDADGQARPGREPTLRQIGDDVLSFAFVLKAVPGITSDNTIRKHVTHVQAVLDRTRRDPRDKRLRLGLPLLDEIPLIEKPPEFEHEVLDDFTTEEIAQILAACRVARAPAYLPLEQRPRWWRNLIVAAANTGLRIGSLVPWVDKHGRVKPGARWDKLREHRGRWWLTVRLKGRKEKPKAVNRFALAAIEDQRPLTGGREYIFDWLPNRETWLHRTHARIVAAAGLPAERRFGFHGYRKWFVTEASEIDAFGTGMQAGHSFDVMLKNYTNRRRMQSAVDSLPQPQFHESKQMFLFKKFD